MYEYSWMNTDGAGIRPAVSFLNGPMNVFRLEQLVTVLINSALTSLSTFILSPVRS